VSASGNWSDFIYEYSICQEKFQVPSCQLITESEFPADMEFLAKWWVREAHKRPVPEIFVTRQNRFLYKAIVETKSINWHASGKPRSHPVIAWLFIGQAGR